MRAGGKSAHSNQNKTLILSLNSCVSFRLCGIQTTEDAENLDIAKNHVGGEPEMKYNLEWPNPSCQYRHKMMNGSLPNNFIKLIRNF